ncbi:MAG TPA: alkaline phosphatase family protein [Candidatus Polarisedimenticolia bacterium]|nr:alkaline phosphatase family protein [Candidatus Polarisedimenticolia bacterium]
MCWAAACGPVDGPPAGRRLVVVAADGAGWPTLSPMMARGELPRLAALYARGSAGTLEAERPLSAAAVWTTAATGRPPAVHGIVFDVVRRPGTVELAPVTADRRRSPALWSIASQRGATVGVAGWPATFPAEEVRGFLLADGEGVPQGRGTMHPPGALAPGGESGEDLPLPAAGAEAARFGGPLEEAVREDLRQLSRAMTLMRVHQPDIMMLRFRSFDAAAHRHWQHHDPRMRELARVRGAAPAGEEQRRLAEAVPAACRWLDAWIGLLEERLPEDATLLIASGFSIRGAGMRDFLHLDVNRLLERLGWLAREGEAIDWSRTRLFALDDAGRTPRALHLNVAGREPAGIVARAGAPSAAREAAAMLSGLRTESGEPLFAWARAAEPALPGDPDVEAAENLSIDPAAWIAAGGKRVQVSQLFRRYGDLYAAHDPSGILLAAGKGIARGSSGWKAAATDLAPTVLALAGLSPDPGMAGRPIAAMLDPAPRPVEARAFAGRPAPLPLRRDDEDSRRAVERLRQEGHLW